MDIAFNCGTESEFTFQKYSVYITSFNIINSSNAKTCIQPNSLLSLDRNEGPVQGSGPVKPRKQRRF